MNEKSILSLLVGPGIFSNKELKEVASKAFNQKFLKEFDELNIKLPDDTRDDGRGGDDAADDASPISIDDEEEKKIMANTRTKQSQALFSSQAAGKNIFEKSRLETVNFDDYEDEEENSMTIPREPVLLMPKLKEWKPNPWEKLTNEQILTCVGTDKGHNVYALTDLYLPTTRETRGNVFKYLYKNLIRNPKDILRLHKGRHENAVVFEKEILRIFKLMYDQKFSLKQDLVVTKPPEASVSILKDSIKNPTAYSHDPIFSPLNSTEWFDSLQHDLMKGIQGENHMEVERETMAEGRTDDAEPVPGSMNHNEAPLGRGARDLRLIPQETSSRRVVNGERNNAGSKTEKYNLASLFESTPNRDGGEASVRSEDQSVANSYANGTPRNEGEMNGRSLYNRTLNQNMREYLNDHYDKDRKALFSFYTGLKGHDKNETALWGETNKEEANEYEMKGTMTTTKGNINYNYMVLPFRNDKERSIFKYQTDFQDDSEIELSLLHKKRRISRESEVKVKPGSYDNLYFNKNVLEASWNDFFFKSKATIPKEKEYSLVLIDLNDKSIFYDKIHPHVFGVQKASKKTLNAIADLPDNPIEEPQMDDHMDIPENPEMQNFTIEGTATKQPYVLGQGERTQHAPSETDSMSIKKTDTTARRTKERLKNLRITAVKQGYDPDKLTMENARVLLDKPGKTESKAGSVSLPPILRLVKDLTRKISTSAVIQHSKVAEEFHFNEFHIKRQDYEYFHRPDLRKLLEKNKHSDPWRVEIVKQEEEKKDPESVLDDPFGVNELVDSFEYFKNHKRLSLREGKFALFEYIEENPLIISNIGMASRINRYVYPYRAYAKVKAKQAEKGITNENEELMEFVKMIKQTLGENGSITFLEDKQSLPLIGQLTNERFIGVTIMDNNLFYAPIFIHKAPETDFVLVRYLSSDGSRRYYLRKIEYIYTVGQIEPKVEVFNPSCRSLTSFIRKSIKHTIKKKFANNESVHMEEMKQLFPTVNDHNMKKYIQYFGGDPDPDDNKRFFYNKDLDHEQNEEDPERNEGNITPEEVCQYERMHASNVRLKNIGLEDLRSCDKINTIRNRYIKRNNLKVWNDTVQADKRGLVKMNIVANYVSEELQLTAWNLSQSFLSSKQKQGRLFLTGFGDPTGGHGGYSYVKLPLKTSRYEKEEKKNNAQKNSQVTGTNADLRKLPIKLVDKMITDYGDYKEEHISKLTRWDKIDLLRQIANEHPDNEELAKYARAFRLTTKMQREKYQKDINNLFMTLIDNLSKPGTDDIVDDGDVEFECNVEQLLDKELEETMKRMPKDQNEQMEDEDKDDDEDEMPDENMNSYDI